MSVTGVYLGYVYLGYGIEITREQLAKALNVNQDLVQPIDHLNSQLPRLQEMFLDISPLEAIGISVPTLIEDALRHKEWYFSLAGKEVP